MRKRITGLLMFLALVLSLLPIFANAVVTDPNYIIYQKTEDTRFYSEFEGGRSIIQAGTLVNIGDGSIDLSLDGGEKELFIGLFYGEPKPLPECDAGYWYLEKVDVKKQTLMEYEYTLVDFYLKQAYPLTFVYADLGTEDHMYFAFKNASDYSDLSNALPERPGYTFLGWYTAEGVQVYDANGRFVAGDYWNEEGQWIGNAGLTLYPHWSGNTYAAGFDANGGSCDVKSTTVTFGDGYGSLPVPQRAGFTFLGWYTEKNGGTKVDGETAVFIPNDHTLYAQWSADTNTITAVVNEQYGSATVPESAATQEQVRITATPKNGCRLDKILVYQTDDPTQTVNVDSENCFTMPAFPVTVEVVFAAYLNDITLIISNPEYGTCSVDRSAAGVGDTVTITATPNIGCKVESLTVTPADPAYTVTVAQDGTFTMPPCAVTVDVSFAVTSYTVTVEEPDAAKGVLAVDKTQAGYGEQIKVTAQPQEGYAVRAIIITDESGTELGVGETFIMPDSNITVKVTFMVIPTYTVTIPATVTLNSQPMFLAVHDAVMEEGVKLQIILHTDLTVRTVDGAENTYHINDGLITDGSVVLSVDGGGTPENPKGSSVELYFKRDAEPKYSGDYIGTISFTIRMIDTGYEYQ